MLKHQSLFSSIPRWLLCLSLFFVIAGVGVSDAWGQAAPKSYVKSADNLTTRGGWSIPITYYESQQGQEASVVLLLHGEGQNKLAWEKTDGLAERLQKDGFAVITCDLRKHGTSKSAGQVVNKQLSAKDYQAMASASGFGELEVIQEFLFKEHEAGKLNMAKLAIVAADNIVPVALTWAAFDWQKPPYQDAPTLAACTPRGQTVRGLVLLSPSEDVPGLNSSKALKFFRMLPGTPVSMIFINGSDRSARDAKSMYRQISLKSNKDAVFAESFSTKFRGSDLIDRVPKADALTVGFLKKRVQEIKVPWRTRVSKLNN